MNDEIRRMKNNPAGDVNKTVLCFGGIGAGILA